MFHDYQEEKREVDNKYLDKELKGQLCKIVGVYEDKDGTPLMNFNEPAISVCFKVGDGSDLNKTHYEKMNTREYLAVIKGEQKEVKPWQLKNLILACGFESKTEKRKVEPNPFDYKYLLDSELYIDFVFRGNDKKYLHVQKVYSLDEFHEKQTKNSDEFIDNFSDSIKEADNIYEASKTISEPLV